MDSDPIWKYIVPQMSPCARARYSLLPAFNQINQKFPLVVDELIMSPYNFKVNGDEFSLMEFRGHVYLKINGVKEAKVIKTQTLHAMMQYLLVKVLGGTNFSEVRVTNWVFDRGNITYLQNCGLKFDVDNLKFLTEIKRGAKTLDQIRPVLTERSLPLNRVEVRDANHRNDPIVAHAQLLVFPKYCNLTAMAFLPNKRVYYESSYARLATDFVNFHYHWGLRLDAAVAGKHYTTTRDRPAIKEMFDMLQSNQVNAQKTRIPRLRLSTRFNYCLTKEMTNNGELTVWVEMGGPTTHTVHFQVDPIGTAKKWTSLVMKPVP